MRTKQPNEQAKQPRARRPKRGQLTQLSLATARKIAQLNQTELADRAGVHPSLISHLEAGTRDIRDCGYELVCRIAWALHVTPQELFPLLFPGKDDQPPQQQLAEGNGTQG